MDKLSISMDTEGQEESGVCSSPKPGGLSWKEFFGSSCDLAPALLSIYDNYATGAKNGTVTPHHGYNTTQSSALAKSPQTLCKSCHDVHHHTDDKHQQSQHRSHSIEILSRDMDEDVQMKEDLSRACRLNGVVSNSSVKPVVCDGVYSKTVEHSSTVVGIQEMCLSPGNCVNSITVPLSDAEARKRPLSVSSTSSSVSSSSSLPRRQRKKIATMATLPPGSSSIVTSLTGDQYCDLCRQHGDCPHKIQRTDVLQTGQCSCAQSNKDGQLRHVCRVHGPAVDISIAKSLCMQCKHSKIGLSPEHSHICDISELCELNDPENNEESESTSSGGDHALSVSSSNSLLQGQEVTRSLSDPGAQQRVGHSRTPSTVSYSHRWGSYLGKVVQEIVETERVYVSDLRDIVQGYIGYLDNSPDLNFENEEKKDLFGNISEIYNFNSEFLDDLEQCDFDPVQVAKCFVDQKQGFLIYTDYCTNYPRCVEVLTKVMWDQQLSEVFKKQQMKLHHALPLGSYLLKPVQRILKYHLFLENMLNNFDKCRVGSEVISLAFQSMTDLAQHINEMKRQHERAVHIQEIQSTLFGWHGDDLTTYGTLILEDNFRVHGAKASRHVYLFEKGLIIAKRKEDGNLLVKGTIKCSDLMLVESIPKEPLSFHVIPFSNPKMQHTLQARSLDHKRKWCQQVKCLMIDNYQAVIPDKAKQLMMKLGKSKEEEDFDETNLDDHDSAKKSHTAPEYLQKRRQRRKSTSIIPDFGLLKNRLARRQNEDSPSGLSHNKSEPTGFVSYLSHTLTNGDVLEEDEEEDLEVLSARGSSSKSSTLESQGLSFDGYSSENIREMTGYQTNSDDLSSEKSNTGKSLSFADIDIDSTCVGGKRISRTDSDESVPNQSDCISKSSTNDTISPPPMSPINNSHSDCDRLVDGQSRDNSRLSGENKEVKVTQDSLDGVVFSNNGVTVPVIGESSTDLKQFIVLPVQGESSTDPPDQHESQAKVKTKGAIISMDCSSISGNASSTAAAVVLQNSLAIDESLLQNNAAGRGCCEAPIGSSTPVSSAQMTRTSDTSPLHTNSTTGSMYSVSHWGSPVRITSDLKNGLSQSKADCTEESMDTADPWVPRQQSKSPCSRYRARKFVFRQFSMNAADTKNKAAKQKRISNLFRSSSCNSLDGGKSGSNSSSKHSSHKRMYSDTSTLVFSNKSAFVSSECPHTLKHSPEVQRSLARYATPPREMGPDYLLEEIQESKEKGRIATRYATPPREVMDPALVDGTVYQNNYTSALENEILENLQKEMQQNATLNVEGSDCSTAGDGGKMWSELQKYLAQDSADSVQRLSSICQKSTTPLCRPDSFHGAPPHHVIGNKSTELHSNRLPGLKSPVAASSASVFNNDGIVDSFKNAVISLTSKITRRSPRSVDASPVRIPTRRARSLGAEEDSRITRTPSVKAEANKSQKGNGKEKKRNRFVFQFARTYSEKLKKNKSSVACNAESDSGVIKRKQEVNLVEQKTVRKPDTTAMAERMANTRPNVIGTYTLRKHKIIQPKTYSESEIEEKDADHEVMDTEEKRNDGKSIISAVVNNAELKVNGAYVNLSESDVNEDVVSLDCFYEKQCNDVLESQLEVESYRDSAVYSDDGGMNSLDSDFAAPCVILVNENNLKVEKKNSFKEMEKSEIKKSEKGKGIQNILKTLEAASVSKPPRNSTEEPPRLSAMKSVTTAMAGDELRKVRMSPSMQRNRCRELLEVAMLTRIRQNSFDGLEDGGEDGGLVCACECNAGDGPDDDGSDDDDQECKPRKGWVKQVVSQFQDNTLC